MLVLGVPLFAGCVWQAIIYLLNDGLFLGGNFVSIPTLVRLGALRMGCPVYGVAESNFHLDGVFLGMRLLVIWLERGFCLTG
jgi:hypothetical protein